MQQYTMHQKQETDVERVLVPSPFFSVIASVVVRTEVGRRDKIGRYNSKCLRSGWVKKKNLLGKS